MVSLLRYSVILYGALLLCTVVVIDSHARKRAMIFEGVRIKPGNYKPDVQYIENSLVFFADRINTPTLTQHSDTDEELPLYQRIEMYLVMQRIDKEAVFLHQDEGVLRPLSQKNANSTLDHRE